MEYPDGEEYALQVLPWNMIRAQSLSTAGKFLKSGSYVKTRLRSLGVYCAAIAKVTDMEELFYCHDEENSETLLLPPREENELAILAYQQVHTHAAKGLSEEESSFRILTNSYESSCQKSEAEKNKNKDLVSFNNMMEGKFRTAALSLSEHRIQVSNALYLMAVSLGSRGFVIVKTDYYQQALALKRSSISLLIEHHSGQTSLDHQYYVSLADTLHCVGYLED